MCNDLIGMIITRIDYLFQQNCASLGNFAAIQLLICIQTNFPNVDGDHLEWVKEMRDKIESRRLELDKKSLALYNFHLDIL